MTSPALARRPAYTRPRPAAHDLVFVGAGASTSYVLRSLLGTLGERPRATPVRIGVVERAADPFGGVAYGGRAARTSLLITPLRDFLPDGERAAFTAWLAQNRHWVFDEFLAASGPASRRWWARHRDAVERDDYEALYLPRYVFGAYLQQRTREAIDAAAETGAATVEVVQDEVLAVEPDDGHHLVRCGGTTLRARHVVLATGSPPVLPRLHVPDTAEPAPDGLVDDPFADMAAAVRRVCGALRHAGGRHRPHVVLIGGNAGTMDMLYQLHDCGAPELAEAVVTVLAPRGELPARVDEVPPPAAPFDPVRLRELADTAPVTAAAVHHAALEDIARGRRAGLSAADTLRPISAAVGRLLPLLLPAEAVEFAGRWGNELGRHQRRAGWEYHEVVEELTATGRLHLVAGTFLGLRLAGGGAVHVRVQDGAGERELDLPAAAVVNCGGPARELRWSGAPLLTQLVTGGVCRTTPLGGGIAVDASLAAAPGLYVMGPLLAGNLVQGAPLWHMEHCGRISTYGTAFGRELAREVLGD